MSLFLKSKSRHLIILLNSLVPSNTCINVYTYEVIYDTFLLLVYLLCTFLWLKVKIILAYPLQMEKNEWVLVIPRA